VLTDVHSSNRVIVCTRDKSVNTLLNVVKEYIAHTGLTPDSVSLNRKKGKVGKSASMSLKAIHTDNEYMKSPLREFCTDKGIKLTSCAPHTHQGNAVAESTVKIIKRVVRRNEHKANTGSKLRAYCWVYSGVQLNRTPSNTDPTGASRSPSMRWPEAPYNHAAQILHPWGCLAYGFVGKDSENPNSASRSRPGIFIGHSTDTSGYLLYHEDTNDVKVYGYLEVFPNVFPCMEMKLAGENPATITGGEWRKYSHFRPKEVADGPFSEFVCGKQLQVKLPQSMYPSFKNSWMATCQRPITLTKSKTVCMRMVFTGYDGDVTKLSKADQECLKKSKDLWVDIPISPPKHKIDNKDIYAGTNLRELLKNTYP
jgi:hypothetical protein